MTVVIDDIDFVSADFWSDDPWPALRTLRREAPVHFDGAVWGIARHADVRWASTNPGIFSSAGGARPDVSALPFMIDMDAPDHLHRRRVVNRWFTPKRISGLRARMTEVTHEIIDTICERGECDAVHELCAWLPMHVIGDMLGFPPEDRASLLQWSDDMMSSLGTDDRAAGERAGEAFSGFASFASDALAERRRKPGDDLLSVLVADSDGAVLDDSQLLYEALLLLIGGDETTRHVLSGGLHQLLVLPDERERMLADRSLITTAVEEMLRWVSPVRMMARTLTRDVEVAGRALPAGDKVVLLYPSANRDETIFEDPERFDVGREPNEHLSFGIGPHHCLGANLARLELQVFFDVIFDRLPDLRLAGDAPLRRTNFVQGIEHLPVSFTSTARRTAVRAPA